MTNGAAMDARKESEVFQDLVLAKKRSKKKSKKAEDGGSKKASTTKNDNYEKYGSKWFHAR
jgi:hypothetical protein